MSQPKLNTYCGFAAIVGRPNVGKSTLLNCILGRKITITSKKPQTTRHRISGVKTQDNVQVIYVDTPGLHQGEKHALNHYMNNVVYNVVKEVDVIAFMVEAGQWLAEDDWVLNIIHRSKARKIIIVNKVDKIPQKEKLLPYLQLISEKLPNVPIVPLSAEKNKHIDTFEQTIKTLLPQDMFYFPAEQYTDRSSRFLVAELIREKLMRFLGDEVPYGATVMLEQFLDEEKIVKIAALILVERKGHKAIVIGKEGDCLKRIGKQARLELERLFGKKVYLQLWVKVKSGWSDDQRALQSLGYD